MLATIPSSALLGVEGYAVDVEVHVAFGLPSCTIVGLPDAACREARDRVRAAILSSGFDWPDRRITINLAPSHFRKVGSALDLPIAIGILVASKVLTHAQVEGKAFLGELGLDGALQPILGVVPLVDAVSVGKVIVPSSVLNQASVIVSKQCRGARNLRDLVALLRERPDRPSGKSWDVPDAARVHADEPGPDLAEVRGQPLGRWAVEVAAAGGHNLLFVGPPGGGKTMLAARLGGLLPDLDPETMMTATRVHSTAGLLREGESLVQRPPFRAPHHTSSQASIVGGGSGQVKPGEISLAHGGVLFLDELAEFPRSVLDTLRQPLEEGVLRLGRAGVTMAFPARFLLVGAMNPCPCGEGLNPSRCTCRAGAKARYTARVSGPLLDRFDLRVPVYRPEVDQYFEAELGETTAVVAARVAEARVRMLARGTLSNAQLSGAKLDELAPLDDKARDFLRDRMRRSLITARGVVRVRRVALTLCDLAGREPPLGLREIAAALELRVERMKERVAS